MKRIENRGRRMEGLLSSERVDMAAMGSHVNHQLQGKPCDDDVGSPMQEEQNLKHGVCREEFGN